MSIVSRNKYNRKPLKVLKANEAFNIQSSGFVNPPEKSDEGFLIVDVVIVELGVLPYVYKDAQGKETTVNEFLDHSIFSKEFIDSCEGAPFVLEHPVNFETGELVDVTPENYDKVVKGVLIKPRIDGGRLLGTLKIWDAETVNLIETRKLSEVSTGYKCNVIQEAGVYEGQEYAIRQTGMILNHLALVEQGRGGENVKVLFNSRKVKLSKKIYNGVQKMDDVEKKENQPDVVNPEKEVVAPEMAKDNLFNQGDMAEMILKMLQQIMSKLGGSSVPAVNSGNPETPAAVEGSGPAPDVAEIKKEVLNSVRAETSSLVLEQINAVEDTYSKAKVVLGGDLSSFAAKYNNLNDFRKAVLIEKAGKASEVVNKMNSFEVKANFDVFVDYSKNEINSPRFNSKSAGVSGTDRTVSLKDGF